MSKITSSLRAIRAKCLDCCCDQVSEIRLCVATNCPLYDFRMGKNPYRKAREYTEEERAIMRERLSKNRPQIEGKELSNDYGEQFH